MLFVALMIISYLLGAIPCGLLIAKIADLGDIRQIGSGNTGATNVLRTGNKPLALATLLLDAGKGAAAALLCLAVFKSTLAGLTAPSAGLLCGLAAVIGHCFSPWIGFKGGKGVATTLGALMIGAPWAGVSAAAGWAIVVGIWRYSSLAGLCAVTVAPLITLIYYGAAPAAIGVLMTLLVFWRHKDNIGRLRDGTEPKIGAQEATDGTQPQTE